MGIFAFIPARYDSTRFPGKPLARIAGRPMIQHVYERALICKGLSQVYVATDDERISACVEGFGGKAVHTGKDHASGTDRICEAALKAGLGKKDIVVNIQGDQPLFHPSLVSLLVEPLLEDGSVSMTTLKFMITDPEEVGNPNHVKVVTDLQGNAIYFSRCSIPFSRDPDEKSFYYKHLGFYGYRMEFLERFTSLPEGVLESLEKLEQLRALENGFKIRVLESPFDSIEVDVPEDIIKIEDALTDSSFEP